VASLLDGKVVHQWLENEGFGAVEVPSDGNCMFHAIAVGVSMHKKMPSHHLVRYQIVEEVRNNFPHYSDLVTEGEVTKMYKDGEWGTDWCVKAAANVCGRTVHALAYTTDQDRAVSNDDGATFAGMWKFTSFPEGTTDLYSEIHENDIVLLCINDNHYNAVVPLGSLAAATAAAEATAAAALCHSSRTMVGDPTLGHKRQHLTSDGGGVSAGGTKRKAGRTMTKSRFRQIDERDKGITF